MMNSLYLEKENQALLWNTIHKSPQIHTLFSSPQQKEKWFNQMIMEMHEKQPAVHNKDQLLSMNRNTISKMMNFIKQKINSYSFELNPKNLPNIPNVPSKNVNGNVVGLPVPGSYGSSNGSLLTSTTTRLEPRSNNYVNAYEMRQKEYESMLKVIVPPPIQFEQIEDKKIQNMEELTEKYIKIRELEIPQNQVPPSNNVQQEPKIQLKINEPLGQELLNENIKSLPKQVHWEMDLPKNTTTQIQYLENEILSMHGTIKTMHSILLDLKEMMNEMHPSRYKPEKNVQMIQTIKEESTKEPIFQEEYNDVYDTQSMIEKIQKIASSSESMNSLDE